MAFQSTVRFDQGGGIPGEYAYQSPTRAEPGILATAATVGMFVSEDPAKPGFWNAGLIAGALRFGIVATPKQYAARGTTVGGTLAPTLVLPANSEAEVATMGHLWALNTAAAGAKPGDVVYFNNTTGAIVTTIPGAAAPATSTLVPGAIVAPRPGAATNPNLIVVQLTA